MNHSFLHEKTIDRWRFPWYNSIRRLRGTALKAGVWRSLVAHVLWEHGAAGSNPVTPTSLRPLGQAVKTPPFHGGNTGSSPVEVAIFLILNRVKGL